MIIILKIPIFLLFIKKIMKSHFTIDDGQCHTTDISKGHVVVRILTFDLLNSPHTSTEVNNVMYVLSIQVHTSISVVM